MCLAVSYWQANDTLRVDHTRANLHSPSKLLQHAPVPPAISSQNGTLELQCALNTLPRFVWLGFVSFWFRSEYHSICGVVGVANLIMILTMGSSACNVCILI